MARNHHILEGVVRAKPQTLKGMGGCDILNPTRSECLRNPHSLKAAAGCEIPNPKWSERMRNHNPEWNGWAGANP